LAARVLQKFGFGNRFAKQWQLFMAIIMLKGSGYGNPGLDKTSFLATYSQNTHSIISASILANSCPKLKIFPKTNKNFDSVVFEE
jgi:hypothetical protein